MRRDTDEEGNVEFAKMRERAVAVRRKYAEFERERYGREWTDEEISLGFVGDVGDLMKLVQAKNGVRETPDFEAKLAHELSDCLWAILVLSDVYDIDLERSFTSAMDDIEDRLGAA